MEVDNGIEKEAVERVCLNETQKLIKKNTKKDLILL